MTRMDVMVEVRTMARIFLCHASEDKPQVREVYRRLKAEGFEPWLDEENLLPGQLWDQEIRRALKYSDFALIGFRGLMLPRGLRIGTHF
jgi:TIR domain